MDTLLVAKLTLTPVLIGAISLASRKFGPNVGGALAGLPWTSSTLSIFLALQEGPVFADNAARGTASAVPAVVVFCLIYAVLAPRGWGLALAAALAGFMAAAWAAVLLEPNLVVSFAAGIACLLPSIILFPHGKHEPPKPAPPAWDIPVRMVAATCVILLLTGFARVLGPAWTGALSPFPVFASVLGVFIHRHDGPEAARKFLRGVMIGLISFATFFLVTGLLLPDETLPVTYLLAGACALTTSVTAWMLWIRFAPSAQPAAEGATTVEG